MPLHRARPGARAALAVFAWLLLDAGAAHALRPLGSVPVPGRARTVTLSGNRVYVTGYAGLSLIDISDPSAPHLRGVLPVEEPRDLAAKGDLVFAAVGASGLVVADFSDPEAPQVLATRDDLVNTRQVEVEDDRLYLTLEDPDDRGVYRLVILDVSDPVAPSELGGFALEGVYPFFRVSNGIVYAASFRDGIRVIDASDPAQPVELPRFPLEVYDLLVHGEHLVVAEEQTLVLFDVSDPRAPRRLDEVEGLFIDGGLAASGDTFFVRGPLSIGVDAWTIDGDSLRRAGSYGPDGPGPVGDLAAEGDLLAVATTEGFLPGGTDRVEIVDASNPEFPKLHFVADPVVFPYTRDIVVSEHRAYAPDWDLGVLIFDVSGLRPVLRGLIELPWARAVAVRGDLAYVSISPLVSFPEEGPRGLRIFDVSDPGAPRELGAIDVETSAGHLVLGGDRVYLSSAGTLRVIDVSDPRHPELLGSVEVRAERLALAGDRVFAASLFGLGVVDVSDPTAPAVVGELDADLVDVSFSAGRLYAAEFSGGIAVFDPSDPRHPVELSRGSLCCVGRVSAYGPLGIVGSGVVRAADLSDPAEPRHLGGAWVGSGAVLYDGRVFAAGPGGVYALDFGPEYLVRAEIDVGRGRGRRAGRIAAAPWGQVRVALHGSPQLDVRRVDPDTLAFGPLGAAPVRRPGRSAAALRLRDVDHDGHTDLVAFFPLAETGLEPGDREGCLTGKVGDVFFNGCDRIELRPLHPPR